MKILPSFERRELAAMIRAAKQKVAETLPAVREALKGALLLIEQAHPPDELERKADVARSSF
jgi:hypothetical protein